jgi:preprotein translocase subunit YajC
MFAFIFAFMGGQQQQGGSLAMWLPIILIFLIMYMLILRPQAKRQKEHQKMLDSLKKGDNIITAGGIYGTIVGVKEKENTLIVKIADNVKIELSRTSIARKLASTDEKES